MKEFILPVHNLIVHPGLVIPLYVDTKESVACIEAAINHDKKLILCPQHDWNYPISVRGLFTTGTLGEITEVLRMPNNTIHTIIKTTDIINIYNIEKSNNVFSGEISPVIIMDDANSEQNMMLKEKVFDALKVLSLYKKTKMDKIYGVIQNYPMAAFVDAVIQITNMSTENAVDILQMRTWHEKLAALLAQITVLIEAEKIESTITRRVQTQMENGQRQAILQEKMRAIQKEMGEDAEGMDTGTLRKKIEKSSMSTDAKEKAMAEFKRMRSMSPMSQEGGLLKTYLEELLAMPWNKADSASIDLQTARQILDSEHSGMASVKERILEHIAVMKKTGKNSGAILCFVGAPGVGKTSLCKSIANALGRKYQRISLGGVTDEAHFRGHRKTYVGAQCGRIMDALKRCKSNNPVIVLDEIDKMGRDWRGDPESALLEILDPEQNKTFRDHYLEVDFDLSNVLFIATSNSLNMSSALKDRIEIIEIPGYSENEKLQIAREHLLKRAANDTGWDVNNIVISDDAILHIIRNFTTEQGVRELQREIATLLRRSLLQNDGTDAKTEFTIDKIDELLSVHQNANMTSKIGFSARI